MKLSNFDYHLPKELIAQYPLKEREQARLLVLNRADGSQEHRLFKDINDYIFKDELLVLNDTKVLSARLKGQRLTGGKVELLLLARKNGLTPLETIEQSVRRKMFLTGFTFEALIKPKRLRLKEKIIFNGNNIFCEVTAKNEVNFHAKDINDIYRIGLMPLPPYIKRDLQELDNIYYQTVYAQKEGSIAAPTAGLHFTNEVMETIKSQKAVITYITLHISYSTFRPVKTEDVTLHKLDKEYFQIPDNAAGSIEETQIRKKRIFAVGTTTLRALETYSRGIKEGFTDLFIYPGYKFKMVNCLLTNFHLPRSSLFILVCAFAGEKLIKKAYQEAIDRGYRFFSYGDAMLII